MVTALMDERYAQPLLRNQSANISRYGREHLPSDSGSMRRSAIVSEEVLSPGIQLVMGKLNPNVVLDEVGTLI